MSRGVKSGKLFLILSLAALLLVVGSQAKSNNPSIDEVKVNLAARLDDDYGCSGEHIEIWLSNVYDLYLGMSAKTGAAKSWKDWWNAPVIHLKYGKAWKTAGGENFKCLTLPYGATVLSYEDGDWHLSFYTNSIREDAYEMQVALWETLYTEDEKPDSEWCEEYGICLGDLVDSTPWFEIEWHEEKVWEKG